MSVYRSRGRDRARVFRAARSIPIAAAALPCARAIGSGAGRQEYGMADWPQGRWFRLKAMFSLHGPCTRSLRFGAPLVVGVLALISLPLMSSWANEGGKQAAQATPTVTAT